MDTAHLIRDPQLARMAEAAKALNATMSMQGEPANPPLDPAQQPPQQRFPQPAPPAPAPPSSDPFADLTPEQRAALEQRIEAARREEKDKLYPDLERYKTQAQQYEEAEQRRRQAEEAEAQRQAEEKRLQDEEELSAKELLRQERERFNSELADMRSRQEQWHAAMEQERRHQELEAYRARVLAENAEEIMPRLRDISWVSGNTPEQINESVRRLVEASANTMQDIAQADAQGQRQMPTVAPRHPSAQPEHYAQGQRQPTAEEIANMSAGEWAQVRHQFVPDAGSGRGIFG